MKEALLIAVSIVTTIALIGFINYVLGLFHTALHTTKREAMSATKERGSSVSSQEHS